MDIVKIKDITPNTTHIGVVNTTSQDQEIILNIFNKVNIKNIITKT